MFTLIEAEIGEIKFGVRSSSVKKTEKTNLLLTQSILLPPKNFN
jgi:hypothetical protein